MNVQPDTPLVACSECGHLHFDPVTGDYVECPLTSEGCNCPYPDRIDPRLDDAPAGPLAEAWAEAKARAAAPEYELGSPPYDPRDVAAYYRPDLAGELAEEVAAAQESARIASTDPSDRSGFSRRVSGVVAVALAALAVTATATAAPSSDPCAKPYPAPATIAHHGRLVPLHPVLAAYARCVRAPMPVGAPDQP